jgi:transposase
MPKPTSPEKVRKVISCYAQGLSQREIVKITGVALGKVNSIIRKERDRILDLDNLRNFYEELDNLDLGPADIEHTLSILKRFDNLGVKMDSVASLNDFFEATGYGDNTEEYIKAGMNILELEKKLGISTSELLDWYNQIAPRREVLEKQVSTLSAKKDQLENELYNLDNLKTLSHNLKERGLSIKKVESFLDNQISLEELGFTKKGAAILANELEKIGLSPENAANRLAAYLNDAHSLEDKTNNLYLEKEKLINELKSIEIQYQEKTKALNRIISRINSTIEREETIIQNQVEISKKQAGEEINSIQDKLNNHRKDLKDIENSINEKKKDLNDLETKKEDLKDRYILGEGLIQLLFDSKSVSLEQLIRIMKTSTKALEYREAGNITSSSYRSKELGDLIVKNLTDFVRKDMIPKYRYTTLLMNRDRIREELDKQKKDNSEYTMRIDELKRRANEWENALGLGAIRQLRSDYQNAPIKVLDNVSEFIRRIIDEKKGYKSLPKKTLSNDSVNWLTTKTVKSDTYKGLRLKPIDKKDQK